MIGHGGIAVSRCHHERNAVLHKRGKLIEGHGAVGHQLGKALEAQRGKDLLKVRRLFARLAEVAGPAHKVDHGRINIKAADELGVSLGKIDADHAATAEADGHALPPKPVLFLQKANEARLAVKILGLTEAVVVFHKANVIAELQKRNLRRLGEVMLIFGFQNETARSRSLLRENDRGRMPFKFKIFAREAVPQFHEIFSFL